jgi:predicted small lipoprotein YifL
MKHRAFSLLVLLSMLLGITACGEKPVPEETLAATDHQRTAPPADNTIAGEISRLMEFCEETG